MQPGQPILQDLADRLARPRRRRVVALVLDQHEDARQLSHRYRRSEPAAPAFVQRLPAAAIFRGRDVRPDGAGTGVEHPAERGGDAVRGIVEQDSRPILFMHQLRDAPGGEARNGMPYWIAS